MQGNPAATEDHASRVEREQHAYEEGLRRQTYELVLGHTEHLYRERRIALAGQILHGHRIDAALEIGCKTWPDFLGRNGIFPKELYCINISENEMAVGKQRLGETALSPKFMIMDAHRLEFPDNHFDVVFGTGILHHLELDRALAEISRVLKPDGILLFGEPLDNNPIGRFIRQLTPRARTADERALRHDALARIGQRFACKFHFEQMLSVPAGVVSRMLFKTADNPLTRGAFSVDELIRTRLPGLAPYFRKVLIEGRPLPGAGKA